MNTDPYVLAFLGGYLLGIVMAMGIGMDALLRVSHFKVHVTTKREAWKWLIGTPDEYAPKDQPGPVTRLIQWLRGTREAEA